jgi:hypothetical protein
MGFGKGLEVPFELMVQLAGVEFPFHVDEGIVLVGYQTALTPIEIVDDCVQFHLEESTSGQINPHQLRSTQGSWAKILDHTIFKSMRCFVGWCESAHVNLGTSKLVERVEWSQELPQKRTLQLNSIGFGAQALSTAPLQAGLSFQTTFRFASTQLKYSPPEVFSALLTRTSMEVAIVYDSRDRRAWAVPKLSLLLHMAHAFARYYKLADHIPYAEPACDGGEASARVLRGLGDVAIAGEGKDAYSLRRLFIGLNLNLMESKLRAEQPKGHKIYGYEFMDVVTEPLGGGFMKRVEIEDPGISWADILTVVDAVVVCAGLGEAITPNNDMKRTGTNCKSLPAGRDYLATTLSCLNILAARKGYDLTTLQNRPIKITDRSAWKLSETAFKECSHGPTGTCWETRALLQQTIPLSNSKWIKSSREGELSTARSVNLDAAIVFGAQTLSIIERARNSFY